MIATAAQCEPQTTPDLVSGMMSCEVWGSVVIFKYVERDNGTAYLYATADLPGGESIAWGDIVETSAELFQAMKKAIAHFAREIAKVQG